MLTLFTTLCLSLAMAQDRGARGDDAAFDPNANETYVPAPKNALSYTNATFARVNPLGFVDLFRLGWKRRLSTKDSLLFRDTYTFAGLNIMATPAYTRVGVYTEAQLLAIFRVFGEYNVVGYYGTFDQVMSWDDPAARFSDQTIAARGAFGATVGTVANLGATLRAAVGPVAIRSTAQVTRYDLDLPDGDVVFYDQFWDRLAPDQGWMVLNDVDVLLLADKARIGVRHTFTDQLGGTPGTDGTIAQHRVGPLLAYQFKDSPRGTRFNQPTAFLVV